MSLDSSGPSRLAFCILGSCVRLFVFCNKDCIKIRFPALTLPAGCVSLSAVRTVFCTSDLDLSQRPPEDPAARSGSRLRRPMQSKKRILSRRPSGRDWTEREGVKHSLFCF